MNGYKGACLGRVHPYPGARLCCCFDVLQHLLVRLHRHCCVCQVLRYLCRDLHHVQDLPYIAHEGNMLSAQLPQSPESHKMYMTRAKGFVGRLSEVVVCRNVMKAQQHTFALSTYNVAVSGVTMTYEMKMGLYATSPPRRFSNHATSSSAVTISAPTFCSVSWGQPGLVADMRSPTTSTGEYCRCTPMRQLHAGHEQARHMQSMQIWQSEAPFKSSRTSFSLSCTLTPASFCWVHPRLCLLGTAQTRRGNVPRRLQSVVFCSGHSTAGAAATHHRRLRAV